MKKLFLSLSALIALGTATSAQTKITFAPEAGLNLSTVRSKSNGERDDNVKPRLGGKVGGVVNFGITKHLSVQPGLFFSMKGANYKYTETVGGVTTTAESKTNVNYLELPVNVAYQFGTGKSGLFIYAGPYVGYALSGKSKYKSTTGNISTENTRDITFGDNLGDVKRLDVGANIGVGYILPMGLYFRAQYGHGFTSIEPKSDKDNYSKNSVFGLSVGFRLGK